MNGCSLSENPAMRCVIRRKPDRGRAWLGAAREYTSLPTVHLVFRLDRETSGIVVIAKDAKMASRLANRDAGTESRKDVIRPSLTGELAEAVTVNQPLGDDVGSPVFVKSAVRPKTGRKRSRISQPVRRRVDLHGLRS